MSVAGCSVSSELNAVSRYVLGEFVRHPSGPTKLTLLPLASNRAARSCQPRLSPLDQADPIRRYLHNSHSPRWSPPRDSPVPLVHPEMAGDES